MKRLATAGAAAVSTGLGAHCGDALQLRLCHNPFNCTEMLEKRGAEPFALSEVNGDEVEAYLLEAGVLHLTDAPRIIIMSNA